MLVSFDTPSTLWVGAGARFRLAEEVQRLGVGRILLVTDQHLLSTGILDDFQAQCQSEHIEVNIFPQVQPDPTDENVAAGLKHLRECAAEALVAIGGGSVMDAAKIIGIAVNNPESLSAFQGYHKIPKSGLPLIAVPTTAGTGSETTKAAVITDTTRQVKMMIFDRKLLPRVSLVDYELSLSMPPQLTAHVGIDTLAHGIEAFVSRKASGMTDPLALSCIQLTARYLPMAYQEPGNREAREAMALAACQGGMAFTNSSVCLVHGMSRPLGAIFHLPHGLSNAVLLPSVTRFSLRGAPARYKQIAHEMDFSRNRTSDESAGEALQEGLKALNAQLGIPTLRECVRVSQSEFESYLDKMAEDALASGSPQNNPVVPSANEIRDLYRSAW
ncbi:MAG: iron-containing alcohol dehydrogenase [Acidobacteriaceae bacterium]|nr:iron-containing alcohol dehydrogenase [Acidobacteriaceae bacterium]